MLLIRKIILFYALIFSLSSLFAQKQTHQWYFGNLASIHFNSGSPQPQTNSVMTAWGGCASIADSNGDLLFYTNGSTVYDKTHKVMQNGSGLMGTSTYYNYGHSVIIVPRPGNPNVYYIFSISRNNSSYNDAIRFSTVNTILNNGKGAVQYRNTLLLEKTLDAKITATQHANGTDYWVIVHETNSNKFYSFLVSSAGVNSTPVTSFAGRSLFFPFTYNWWSGNLKASPDGTKIASTYHHYYMYSSDSTACELFDFNNSTGKLSNVKELYLDNFNYFWYTASAAIEFSPDGSKIYLTDHPNYWTAYQFDIYQFEVHAGTAQDINNSKVKVATSYKGSFWYWYSGAMQLASDGKIYVNRYGSTYLAAINAPNQKGIGCCFEDSAVGLAGKTCYNGLPLFVQSWLYKKVFEFEDVCVNDSAHFTIVNESCLDSVLWNFDDPGSGHDSISTDFAPAHLFSSPGVFDVTLTTYRMGTENTTSYEINVFANPDVKFFVNDTSQCFTDNYFIFSDSSTISQDSIVNNFWDFGDGVSFSEMISDTNHSYSFTDTFEVKLVVTSNKGCMDSMIQDVYVNPEPNPGFSINDTVQCLHGNLFDFTNSTSIAYGNLAYYWTFGDTGSSSQKDTTYRYYSHDTFLVTMIVNSEMNCADTLSKNVYVHPSPLAIFFINDTSQCLAQNEFVFIDSSTIYQDTLNYLWDFGDGSFASIDDTSHIYQQDGTFAVKLIVSSSLGCPDSMIQNLHVRPDPIPEFAINDSAQCFRNNYFSFTNNSTINTGSMTYYWDFGDNSTSTLKDPDHSYSSQDTFKVKLICTSDYGCVDSISKTVIVHPMPVSDFSINDSIQCLNENVFNLTNLSAISSGSLSFHWSLGNGYTSTSTDVVNYTYIAENMYIVQLIAVSSNYCRDTISKQLRINPSPASSFAINKDKQCERWNRFNFTNYSTINSGSNSYVWDFGDFTNSTAINPTKVYISDDTFSIKLLSISNLGCRDSVYQSVIVFPNPVANFQINDSTQCFDGNNFIFYNNSNINSGYMTYFWDFGDFSTSTLTTPSHSYSSADTFNVMLIATSDQNCYDTFYKQTLVHVHPMPEAAFSITDSIQCLSGNSFTFFNSSSLSSGTLSYIWLFDDSDSSTNENPTHSYVAHDTFHVKLYAISNWNCKDSASHMVITHPQPEVDFSISDSSQCFSGNLFNFMDQSSIPFGSLTSPVFYLSDGFSKSGASLTYVFKTADTFQVKLLLSSDLGCIDSMLKNVYVRPMPLADFAIDNNSQCVRNNQLICTDLSSISSGSISSWYWETGDTNTYNSQNLSHHYNYYDTFTVFLKTTSTYSCSDSISRKVFIHPMPLAKFGVLNPAQCLSGNEFEFIDSSSIVQGSIANYNWNTGDNNQFITKDLTHNYLDHDTFEVWHIVESALGCKDSISTAVFVHPMPEALFHVNDSLQCLDGNSFRMINQSQIDWGNLSYYWQFGDYVIDTLFEPVHTYNDHQSYFIKLDVSSDLNCKDSFLYPVVVHPMPVADFNFSQVCLEQNTYFSDTSSVESPDMLNQWDWDFGTGDVSNLQDPVYMFTTSGTKSVTLIVTTDKDCADDTSRNLFVNEHVNTIDIIRATVTENESILVEWNPATSGVPMHYILQRSGDGVNYSNLQTFDNQTFNYEDMQVDVQKYNYYYRVIVEDSCLYQSAYSNYGRNLLLQVNDDEEFPILTWNAYEQWPFGVHEYVAEIFDDPSLSFEELERMSEHELTVEDKFTEKDQENYCYRITAHSAGNIGIISQSNVLCIPTTMYVFMPNAFTPNGDGTNDVFKIKARNVRDYKISIYDRWGELMFSSTDFHDSWDGLFQGKACPVGTYVYVINALGSGGQSNSTKGTLQLIR